MTGGVLVSEPVVDYPFEVGPLPEVALALGLRRPPRGREELRARFVGEQSAGWPSRS